jgi:hypothetical protein
MENKKYFDCVQILNTFSRNKNSCGGISAWAENNLIQSSYVFVKKENFLIFTK